MVTNNSILIQSAMISTRETSSFELFLVPVSATKRVILRYVQHKGG